MDPGLVKACEVEGRALWSFFGMGGEHWQTFLGLVPSSIHKCGFRGDEEGGEDRV